MTCCLRIVLPVSATVHHVSWSLNSTVVTVCRRLRASAKSCHNCCTTIALKDAETLAATPNVNVGPRRITVVAHTTTMYADLGWLFSAEIQISWPSLALRCRGHESRRAAQPRGLLEGIGQLDQLRLAECSTHECHANRQPKRIACWHRDCGISGQCGRLGAPSHLTIAIDQVNLPRRADRRHHQRIQLKLLHYGINTQCARQLSVLLQHV